MTYATLSSPFLPDRSRWRVPGRFSRFAFGLAALFGFALAITVVSGPVSAQGLFGDGDAQRREAATALQIDQLQGQIRNLNGQIEQMGFQLRQLQDQIVKMQKDTDFRLQELENGAQQQPAKRPPKKTELTPNAIDPGGNTTQPQGLARTSPDALGQPPSPLGSASSAQTTTSTELSDDDATPPANIGLPPTGLRPGNTPQILGAPPQVLGQIPRSQDPLGGAATDGPIDLSQGQQPAPVYQRPNTPAVSPVPGVTPKYANVQPTPSARDEYDAAYGYILSGEYDLAERSFKTFLANHPTDRRAGSAQYWLGESYFERNQHREATDAFLKSYTQYPDDVKAPDSLLKLGLAYQGLGERKAACNAYDELLTKYPKASKALRDRAQIEKSRGKCA